MDTSMTERTYKILTAVIAVFSLTPLMLVHSEMWDMTLVEMAWSINDFTLIKDWLTRLGYYLKYYVYPVTHFLNQLTGIPHKFFTNALSVASVLGIAYEMFLILTRQYHFDRKVAYFGAWTIIAFPVWHTLISSAVFINILCIWTFLLGLRLWKKNKIIAAILIIPSFQLYSLFAFAVGLLVSDFMLTANRENYKRKAVTVFLGSLGLLICYVGLTSIINVHGEVGYNTIRLENILMLDSYAIMAVACLLITFFIQRKIEDAKEAEQFVRHMLSFLTLALFACLAYWAVGRGMRFFSFGSFTSRHTFLTCIPFAVLMSMIAQYLQKRIRPKAYLGFISFVMLALIVVLHQGHSHKIAATVFKDMLIKSFKKIDAPPSGYVGIVVEGAKPPRHVHNYSINMCLYKAYGKSEWKANGFWRRSMKINRKSLEKLYDMTPERLRHALVLNGTGDAYTKYVFHLTDYHQEGRFWYWIYHLLDNYDAFKPRLELVEQTPEKNS